MRRSANFAGGRYDVTRRRLINFEITFSRNTAMSEYVIGDVSKGDYIVSLVVSGITQRSKGGNRSNNHSRSSYQGVIALGLELLSLGRTMTLDRLGGVGSPLTYELPFNAVAIDIWTASGTLSHSLTVSQSVSHSLTTRILERIQSQSHPLRFRLRGSWFVVVQRRTLFDARTRDRRRRRLSREPICLSVYRHENERRRH